MIFKVGDKVRCISDNKLVHENINVGDILEIEDFDHTNGFIKLLGIFNCSSRFELVPNLSVSTLYNKEETNLIDHPSHYKVGGVETIDFIEAKGFNFRLANAVKYLSRANHKGTKKADLQKAIWYIQREIDKGDSV
jgi:hypothetical protein